MIRTALATLILNLAAFAMTSAQSGELYLKTFGSKSSPALIYLHGGPGYNSAAFEAGTPQRLADGGFFVIVYDRRGEGRSKDTGAQYTFEESNADLQKIYERFGLKKATLLGHSFGGVIGTKFATAYPDKVRALVLVSAPVELQATFRNIISRCRAIYQAKNDSIRLNAIGALQKMDTASMMYASFCFGHAIQNGFYSPKERSAEAKAVYERFKSDTALFKEAARMDFRAPKGYWEHERYTTIDLRPALKALVAKKVAVHGLYGKEDGLYSPEQVAELQQILGKVNVRYLDSCSHNVFIDQQSAFVQAMKDWAR